MDEEDHETGEGQPAATTEKSTIKEDEQKQMNSVEEDQVATPESLIHKSHFRNEEFHSIYVRYGVPLFLVGTFVFLVIAHVGSGVSAEYILLRDGEIQEQRELLLASIFSSVHELWNNGSYPLAILIVVTSISWPYVKLFVAFYAWFQPYTKPRRREFLIEVIDVVGKWTFVDIVVLVEIMVAFRYA